MKKGVSYQYPIIGYIVGPYGSINNIRTIFNSTKKNHGRTASKKKLPTNRRHSIQNILTQSKCRSNFGKCYFLYITSYLLIWLSYVFLPHTHTPTQNYPTDV